MVMDRGQRIGALGRGAVAVGEMDLDELAGDEVQRLAVGAHERQVRDAGREHPPRDELQGELDDGQARFRNGARTDVPGRRCNAPSPEGCMRDAYTTGR